ncbi:MAG: VWA domain-containing protein, partial [Planctomycetota bacterium]
KEAQRIYREARRQGLRSVLLAQEGPCLFSHRIANVAPAEAIDVEFHYFHTLPHRDGWYEFVYPMVQRQSAVERDDEGTPTVELPARRSGRNVHVRVAIDAGLPIEAIESPSHKVTVQHPYRSRGAWARVALATARYVANRDFVVRYRVAGDALRSTMLFHRSKLGGFFTLMLHPPADLEALPRQPVELIFALDASGSMKGAPVRKATAAVRQALRRLSPRDTFQILRFAGEVEPFETQAVTATAANVQRAEAWLDEVEARGGTDLYEGVRTALALPEPGERLRFLVVLTDGCARRLGDVLSTVARKAGGTRVFSIGLGEAPDRYLLERMAQLGRGAVAYVGQGDDPAAVTDRFVTRATRPAMTHLSIDWGALRVADVYPERVPDVFHGRPVVLVGRFRSARATTVRIRGLVAGEPREIRLDVDPADGGPAHTGIAPLWAKAHIAALARELAEGSSPGRPQRIVRLARHFNLVTPLTDMLVIDTVRGTRTSRSPAVVIPDAAPQSLDLSPTLFRP